MKIAEVLLLEAYFDELEVIVQDRLAQYVGSDKNEIPTEEFRQALADDGFLLSFEELKSQERKFGFKEAQSDNFFRTGEKNQWKNVLIRKWLFLGVIQA